MNKLKLILTVFLILSLVTGCYAPAAPDSSTVPGEKPQAGEPAEPKQIPQVDPAEAILRKMTPEEKIGQLMIVGFQKDVKAEDIEDYINRYKVSGFILFERNYPDFDSQYALVETLKKRNSAENPLPLFISVDEEGGTVSRLPKGGTHFPDAKLVGKVNDPELTYTTGQVIGRELSVSGINMNFAPVLDIVESSNNKLLIKRSYGSSAEAVSLHGTAFIGGLQSSGVIAVPKHFPGHGATVVDSHGKLPVIDTDEKTLNERELVPFKEAMKNELDAVMVGHIAFPKLDPSGLPATKSGYFLTDVLRKQMGFKGLAISDDIEMYGYMNGSSTLEESVIVSFNAGLDVFLISHSKEIQDRVLNTLIEACRDGRITEERLNESVLRIIRVKLKHRISDTMEYSLEEARHIFGSEEHRTVLAEVNKAIKK